MTSTPPSTSLSNRKLIIHSLLVTNTSNVESRPLVGSRHFVNQKVIDNYNSIYHSGILIDGYVQCRKCTSILLKRKRDNANLKRHMMLHDNENVVNRRNSPIKKKIKSSKSSTSGSCHDDVSADTESDSKEDVWYDAIC